MFHFDYFGKRRWFFLLSLVLLLAGLAFALIFGVKLDIQFKGGSILKYAHATSIDLEKASQIAAKAVGVEVSAQEVKDNKTGDLNLVLNMAGDQALSVDQQATLRTALAESFPEQAFTLVESFQVDPFIGREFLTKGLLAVLLASVLIVLYVAFRFRTISGLSAGVMALVALVHDVLMVLATFVVTRTALNEALIAVMLTILGFSINDTIVIYDRIRENTVLTGGKMPLAQLVNLSINQSLTRSLNTSLATFSAIAVAYAFAAYYNIQSVKDFALPMMVGVISGSYSTIFIAGPLWVMWKTRKGEHMAPVPPPPPAPASDRNGMKTAKGKA